MFESQNVPFDLELLNYFVNSLNQQRKLEREKERKMKLKHPPPQPKPKKLTEPIRDEPKEEEKEAPEEKEEELRPRIDEIKHESSKKIILSHNATKRFSEKIDK